MLCPDIGTSISLWPFWSIFRARKTVCSNGLSLTRVLRGDPFKYGSGEIMERPRVNANALTFQDHGKPDVQNPDGYRGVQGRRQCVEERQRGWSRLTYRDVALADGTETLGPGTFSAYRP